MGHPEQWQGGARLWTRRPSENGPPLYLPGATTLCYQVCCMQELVDETNISCQKVGPSMSTYGTVVAHTFSKRKVPRSKLGRCNIFDPPNGRS